MDDYLTEKSQYENSKIKNKYIQETLFDLLEKKQHITHLLCNLKKSNLIKFTENKAKLLGGVMFMPITSTNSILKKENIVSLQSMSRISQKGYIRRK